MKSIRLNLGCGDKILDGYLNVDVSESRGGKKPDLISDIRTLKELEKSTADEILAVHVIEHIDRWDVVSVLRRWHDILKPNGRIVLESPNLISACKAIVENPRGAARADKQGQFSMWPLYGDPSWKDPLMMHKWLYTPHSLAEVMYEAGFRQIQQQPAKFKMREPRDMRIVGIKSEVIPETN